MKKYAPAVLLALFAANAMASSILREQTSFYWENAGDSKAVRQQLDKSILDLTAKLDARCQSGKLDVIGTESHGGYQGSIVSLEVTAICK